MKVLELIGIACLSVLLAAAPPVLAQASFQGLGDLSGGATGSTALGVSGDGRVVVGHGQGPLGQEAVRWADGVATGLGDLPGGIFGSRAHAVAQSDSVVVGYSWVANGAEAFRWSEATGMVGLGDLPGGNFESIAHDVSADGSVVIGEGVGADDGTQAFRWTASGGMVGLGDLPGGGKPSSYGHGVSADGNVVVGRGRSDSGTEAFMWTPAGGMVSLGTLPGPGAGGSSSSANAVSDDGTVIVGRSGIQAFRWTAATGMVGLGFPPGATGSDALAVSADGSVVVGGSGGGTNTGAFIWTAQDGMRSLRDVLIAAGVDMDGWTLQQATGVSSDGSVIVGIGTNPQGLFEAWRAVLPGKCEEPLALRSWLNPAGGAFGDPNNWSTSAVPTGSDRALFGLPDGADYTVTFATGHSNDQVMLRGGNHVRFALGGQAYELDAASGCGPSLDVADAFDSPRLEIENGSILAIAGTRVDGPAGTELIAKAGGSFLLGGGMGVGMEAGRTGHIRLESGGDLSMTAEGVSTIGGAGEGSLTVEGGGEATFFGSVRVGDAAGSSGELLATGSGADLALFGSTVIGASGVGRLTGADAGDIEAREVVLGRLAGGDGMLVAETNAEVSARDVDVGVDGLGRVRVRTLGALIVSGGVTIPRGAGPGSVRVASDGGMTAGVIRLRTGGSLTVAGIVATGQLLQEGSGQLNLAGGCLTIQGGPCQTNLTGAGGTVEADSVWIGPGAVFDSTTVQLGPGGVLGEAGSLPLDLTNAGTINPGDSAGVAGTFTIGGAYAQAPAGALEIELGGTASGAYDHLSVTGAAALEGTLRFSHINGFTPAPGDVFEVLSAGLVSGSFANVEGPAGSTYSVSYGPTSVIATVLTVANEPPAGAAGLALHPPAPNPASGSVALRYELPVAGPVRLVIADAIGRRVLTLIDGHQVAGVHEAAADLDRLAPGPYVVRLEAASVIRTTLLTVIR